MRGTEALINHKDKRYEDEDILSLPFRLFDCLGLLIPFSFFEDWEVDGLEVDCFLFLGGGGGSGAGLRTGEERNADGEGIVIVSISKNS